MMTTDRTNRGSLRFEAVNRACHEIQSKWTEAERSHRRQLAECRMQALARALLLTPIDKSPARHTA
jgi:hypothetical protein